MNTFIIAEIAQAHDGSLGILHSYIDALAQTGVNAVKFQTHIAEAESSVFEPFRVNFSLVDKTRFDYWKRMEFTKDQWSAIKRHCEDVGLEFMSSPFSIEAVELLEQLQIKRYKIASGETSNSLLLERIARTQKPIIFSSGMSDLQELETAFALVQQRVPEVSILQCTTMYPTPPEKLGINLINELKQKFNCKVGFSDHSGEIYACLAAKAMGADILEFHAVFDKRMFGPDASSSLTIDEIKNLVKGVRYIEKMLDNPLQKTLSSEMRQLKDIFGKSLAVRSNLDIGHTITFADLESKKPSGHGISASAYQSVIGRKLVRPLKKYSFINYEDLE